MIIDERDEIKKKEAQLKEAVFNQENTTKENLDIAEAINYKAHPDAIIPTDEFGILQSNHHNQNIINDEKKRKKEMLKINARIEKWNVMMEEYQKYTTSKFRTLKKRTRKGVPDSLRSFVWQKFSDMTKYYVDGLYKKCLDQKGKDNPELITIIKDLDRTFPNILLFKEKYGTGQRFLYHVLTAYSNHNKETGYVQGMGYITAMLLTYMNEESAFFVLESLMKKYNMEGFYKKDFPDMNKTFFIMMSLMKKYVPKVYRTLVNAEMNPSMYASEWFITLFSKELHFNVLVRIFDVFLLEGFKVMYRFSLAFLKLNEHKLILENDLIGIMPILKSIFEDVNADQLFNIAFGFGFTRGHIKKLDAEYIKIVAEKRMNENEITKLL